MANASNPVGLSTPSEARSIFMTEGEKGIFEALAAGGVEDACRRLGPGDQGVSRGAADQGHSQLRGVCRKIDFLHNTIAEPLAATE